MERRKKFWEEKFSAKPAAMWPDELSSPPGVVRLEWLSTGCSTSSSSGRDPGPVVRWSLQKRRTSSEPWTQVVIDELDCCCDRHDSRFILDFVCRNQRFLWESSTAPAYSHQSNDAYPFRLLNEVAGKIVFVGHAAFVWLFAERAMSVGMVLQLWAYQWCSWMFICVHLVVLSPDIGTCQ